MNKKSLTETDIRTKFITPALVGPSGEKWHVLTQIREEVYFTKGRVIVRAKTVKRGEAKKADYVLSYKPNLPIAVIEAKVEQPMGLVGALETHLAASHATAGNLLSALVAELTVPAT